MCIRDRDWLPQDMEKDLDLYDRERWNKTDIMRKGNVEEAYRWVCDGLDALLKKHGYERDDMYYRVNEPVSYTHLHTDPSGKCLSKTAQIPGRALLSVSPAVYRRDINAQTAFDTGSTPRR